MIAVFLSNKLISTDAVAPLMLDVKCAVGHRRIRFYSMHEQTCEDIRENIILWDILNASGKFVCLGCSKRGLGRLAHRIRVLGHLLELMLLSLLGKVRFVHFKQLNSGPLSLLARLNAKDTVYMESNCWGYHKLMIEQVGNIDQTRKVSAAAGRGSTLIGFSPDWPELSHPENAAKAKLVIPSTHLGSGWLNFVNDNAGRYISADFARAGIEPQDRFLVYILGFFGKFRFFDSENTMLELFRETLDVMAETVGDVPVLIKPHVITDMAIVREELDKRKGPNWVISQLHPGILATGATAFVANYYSTTFADAHSFQVPTIEYTSYSSAVLDVTHGGSMRPEQVTHFLDRDRRGLARILKRAVTASGSPALPRARDADLAPAVELLAS